MDLVIVLRFLVGKYQVKPDLVGLVHHGAMTGCHLADMEMERSRDGLQELVGSCDQLIHSSRILRIGPKDDDV